MRRALFGLSVLSLLLWACGGSGSEPKNPPPGPPPGPGPTWGGGPGPTGPPPPGSGQERVEIRRKPDGTCVEYRHPACPPTHTCDPSVPRPVPCPPGI